MMEKIAILWFHGLGDTEQGWSEIIQSEWEFPCDVKWRFPRAPVQSVDCNGGAPSTSWFNIDDIPVKVGAKEYEEDMKAAVSTAHKELDGLMAAGVKPERIFIGGFSQGGALGMQAAFSYPHKLGGIINFSGWLTPSTIVGGVQNKPPLLWWHGSADMVVSFPLQRAGVEKLKAMGITDITVKEQPRMGHSSHPDQMEYVPDWINKLLGGKGGQKEEL